jgi:nucleoside-diphosphate kinase
VTDAIERTLVLVKPDGVRRQLVGEILGRIERKGLTIAALELKTVTDEVARAHYAEHEDKPFFPSLLEFITSGPVVAAVIEGPRAIETMRKLMGATFGWKAEPGTIRGDYSNSTAFNLVHGSDSPEAAAAEIALYFKDNEIVEYERSLDAWLVSEDDA